MDIPRDRIQVSYSRSGGPGGQNVNKVETRVEIRFVLAEADWIPEQIRLRIANCRRLTKNGELVLTSSRFRTRARNQEDCFERLEAIIKASTSAPKKRRPTRPSANARKRRLEAKRRRSQAKQQRSWRPDSD